MGHLVFFFLGLLALLVSIILQKSNTSISNSKRFELIEEHCLMVLSHPETYRGAVVEYSPVQNGNLKNELVVIANVKNYINFMNEAAKKKVDIIVFPEGGLFIEELSVVPDPSERIAPCDNLEFETSQALRNLSLASKNNKIYSVINLLEKRKCTKDDEDCPSEGYYTFNTNVVFDREGVVIARYAKFNLFDEKATNHTKDPELVFFDTDFGVRFGTFICFDILFSTPAQRLVEQYHIKDFVFSTFWFSELPFLTALQTQKGWAETHNVNLLASGINILSRGSTGSGIYNGKYGHIVQLMSRGSTSKLLIADIPKFQDSSFSGDSKRETRAISRVIDDSFNSSIKNVFNEKMSDSDESDLKLLKDQIKLFSSEIIEGGKIFQKTVCSLNDFCCDFYVNMDSLSPQSRNYTYRAMVFNGVRKFGETFKGGIQSCGVVVCDGPDITNCTSRVKRIPKLFKFKEIKIKGNFKRRNSFQFPSTLTDGKELLPLPSEKYEFTKAKTDKSLEVSLELLWPVHDLHTFAIWGRDFTRDMEPEIPTSGVSDLMPLHILFATSVAYILFSR